MMQGQAAAWGFADGASTAWIRGRAAVGQFALKPASIGHGAIYNNNIVTPALCRGLPPLKRYRLLPGGSRHKAGMTI